MSRRSILLSLACLLPLAAPVAAQPDRALSVEQVALEELHPDATRVDIAAELTDPDGVYRVGDTVGLTVRLSRDAYLTILNVDASGRTTVLFPNDFHPDPKVAGGTPLEMPGEGARIVATGPAGLEIVKVIASDAPLDLAALADFTPAGPFRTSGPRTASRLARALSVEALETAEAPATQTPAAGTPSVEPSPPAAATAAPAIWGEVTLRLVTEDAPASEAAVPAASAFNVTLASDHPQYRLGDEIRFTVAADKPCTLTLITAGPAGAVEMLLPNPTRPAAALVPGTSQEIAGFVAQGPAGAHSVRAYCTLTAEGAAPPPATPGTVAIASAEPEQPATGARDITVALPDGVSTDWAAQADIEIEIVE